MGLILEEKTRKKLEDGKRAVFTLSAYTDDFHPDNEEGAYTCNIRVFDGNDRLVDEYFRLFLVRIFNERHYKAFIQKFVRDQAYREQFNIRQDTKEQRPDGWIDIELQDIILRLNDLGLRTKYSCQGTRDPWIDRPHHSDGHSITAYILFEKQLPDDFLSIALRYPSLHVNYREISTKRRSDNIHFADIIRSVIDQWVVIKKNEIS
ncbi:hypothetical protein [Aneurinibacillus danicus]|jgi:hypothetical protein|uniref:Uncharacterized protein n=1 Tax=Aneurinibacillus danicus TaxID=267746 RepID=A0A511V968_9BACL|nr:hypothetical protein [Aneurinibacillus danicus]GEN35430.1 hypothetical protein ADA01nite_28900 [Aneurinibacillus danicus]